MEVWTQGSDFQVHALTVLCVYERGGRKGTWLSYLAWMGFTLSLWYGMIVVPPSLHALRIKVVNMYKACSTAPSPDGKSSISVRLLIISLWSSQKPCERWVLVLLYQVPLPSVLEACWDAEVCPYRQPSEKTNLKSTSPSWGAWIFMIQGSRVVLRIRGKMAGGEEKDDNQHILCKCSWVICFFLRCMFRKWP